MHRIKITFVPGTNKDGSPSKTNGKWQVTDRTRGKTILVSEIEGKNTKAFRSLAEDAVSAYRKGLYDAHVKQHPNDKHFISKHGDREN